MADSEKLVSSVVDGVKDMSVVKGAVGIGSKAYGKAKNLVASFAPESVTSLIEGAEKYIVNAEGKILGYADEVAGYANENWIIFNAARKEGEAREFLLVSLEEILEIEGDESKSKTGRLLDAATAGGKKVVEKTKETALDIQDYGTKVMDASVMPRVDYIAGVPNKITEVINARYEKVRASDLGITVEEYRAKAKDVAASARAKGLEVANAAKAKGIEVADKASAKAAELAGVEVGGKTLKEVIYDPLENMYYYAKKLGNGEVVFEQINIPDADKLGFLKDLSDEILTAAKGLVAGVGKPKGAEGRSYTLEELSTEPFPVGVDSGRREEYLSDADFEAAFKMPRSLFNELKQWEKNVLKRFLKLF